MTNGLLINEEWAERLAKHAPEVPVSLNATTQQTYETIMVGAKYKKMRAAIEHLRSAKVRLDSPLQMRAHMTIVKENIREIPDFIGFARDLGFDSVDYGFDNVVPSHLERNPELFRDVQRRLPEALHDPGIEVDVKTLKGLALCSGPRRLLAHASGMVGPCVASCRWWHRSCSVRVRRKLGRCG
jgi:MoaA/NifB/PqqE/SkfB family radical SAM enzyme